MLNVFISGFERQSGKTLITAGLAATMQSLSYPTTVYKPIQTGAGIYNGVKTSLDLAFVNKIDASISTNSTYLISSIAPPFVSAYEDGLKVDVNTIYTEYQSLTQTSDCIIVEGANSISTPVAQYMTEIDIVKTLRIPLVLVVNPKVTTLDSVIAGLKFIQSEKVEVLGVIINQYDEDSDKLEEKYFPQILKEYSNVNILGVLPDYKDFQNLSPETLIADVLNRINIEDLFCLKIAKLNA